MENEIWKPVIGFESKYEVSTLGRFRNRKNGYVLKPVYYKNGYTSVSLQQGTRKLSHRVIAMNFIPGDHSLQVNHKNGIRDDNRVQNLEWCTSKENTRHSFESLGRRSTWLGRFGDDNPNSKPVLQFSKDGVFIKRHGSVKNAAKSIGSGFSLICRNCRNEGKSAYGYIWRYE